MIKNQIVDNFYVMKSGRTFTVQLCDSYWVDNGEEFSLQGFLSAIPEDLYNLLHDDPLGVYQIGTSPGEYRNWRLHRSCVGGFQGIIDMRGRLNREPYQLSLI
jgi:hypothetical protein